MNLTANDGKKLLTTLIELRKPLLIVALLWGLSLALLLASEVAKADLLCDCSEVVDTCSATVGLDGMRVKIESDSDACSRVDYLVEGQPFAALVVGGSSEVNWPGQPLREPQIIVENCRVCADAKTVSGNTADAPVPVASDANSAARPIVKIMPTYPRNAWTNRVEGMVTVKFNVSVTGIVENIRVLDATNPLFVNDSIDAISRFRYSPAMVDGNAVAATDIREQFVFRIINGTDPVVNSKTL